LDSNDAVTFMAIDECGGKLDVRATTTPPHLWKQPKPTLPLISLPRGTGQIAPQHGARMAA
jgi:hypothetical protein